MNSMKSAGLLVLLLVIVNLGASSCAARSDPNAHINVDLPDRDQFINGGVSEFMSRRCGALDCHGNVARPLRLYGATGLRLEIDEAQPRDTRPTTDEEHRENYKSVIGLEPEDLSRAKASRAEFVKFMLFLKPLSDGEKGVKHKGGPVLRDSDTDDGWMCLVTWVAGQVDPARCKAATF